MSDTPADAPKIEILVRMHRAKIDVGVKNPVSLDDLVASFKRAGITHLICHESGGGQVPGGFAEELEFEAILPEGGDGGGYDTGSVGYN